MSLTFHKITPGQNGELWEEFLADGIASIDYSHLDTGDISSANSMEEVRQMAGFDESHGKDQTWNLWLFKNAKVGDIVFATLGKNTCLGIGRIASEYYYTANLNSNKHRRKVDWIVNKRMDFQRGVDIPKGKNAFRPDTFAPSHKGEFILASFAKRFPDLIPVFERYGLPHSEQFLHQMGDEDTDEVETSLETRSDVNYWWLQANPKIWDIAAQEIGAEEYWTARNKDGNPRRIYRHFKAVKPGDLAIGYSSGSDMKVRAIFEFTRSLHEHPELGEIVLFKVLKKFPVPVSREEIFGLPEMQNSEIIRNNQGSLFSLSQEEYETVQDLLEEANAEKAAVARPEPLQPYTIEEALKGLFLGRSEFEGILDLLRHKKNIVLQGPPGVGKTYIAARLAYAMMKVKDPSRKELVQFHQSYAYEDFVQGLRPDMNGGFALKNGLFKLLCERAIEDPEHDYFLIIDEINRGNLAKIFGELMLLVEADKRSSEYEIKLTYEPEKAFFVPKNLHLIGTMNTADRSLAVVDYALRRRFAFIDLEPNFGEKFRSWLVEQANLSEAFAGMICTRVTALNREISKSDELGKGFMIGHSYFCKPDQLGDPRKWYDDVMKYEIAPLLREYWFDQPEKANTMIEELSKP